MSDIAATYADVRTRLFKRAQESKVQYGDKTAYPADAQLMMNAVAELDRASMRSNELYRMLSFLRDHEGQRIGEHSDWIAGMEKLLDGESFDALSSLRRIE